MLVPGDGVAERNSDKVMEQASIQFLCENEKETVRLARTLGKLLEPGDLIALNGTLGAGKTSFVRAVAGSLGIDESLVNSPTYMIVQSYSAQLLLHHFDLYRIQDEEELYESGCDEFLNSDGVCLIEWANRFPGFLPDDHLEITFEIISETARQLTVRAGRSHERFLKGLRAAF